MATILEPSQAVRSAPEGSDRGFGVVFAVVFVLIGCWPLLYRETPRWWALAVAAAFALAAWLFPRALAQPNRWWLAFGRLLHRIVSPLVMGTIFFLCVTPIALLMRLLGKDVLSLRRGADLPTYWTPRDPSPSETETMRRQF